MINGPNLFIIIYIKKYFPGSPMQISLSTYVRAGPYACAMFINTATPKTSENPGRTLSF